MSIEQRINNRLNRYPALKRFIKRLYQMFFYMISSKRRCVGRLEKVSPDDGKEYFFGYYDKSPWDASGRYMICLQANNTWSDPTPKDVAKIVLIDTYKEKKDEGRISVIAETRAWNVQQGCMLQWRGPCYDKEIIFNDYRDGKLVSVILNITSNAENIVDFPVYSVSSDGKCALSLDFSRLYNLRPGYGYYNVPEATCGEGLPDATAIWKIDLDNNLIKPILTYKNFTSFLPRKEMLNREAIHKVNHIMINPSGTRFMVLYRWFIGNRKYTRLITADLDGNDMYLLLDDDMVSHCCWKDDNTILAFAKTKESGAGYYLCVDKTDQVEKLINSDLDGHPSYSPDKKYILTDTYADKERMCSLKVFNGNNMETIAKVFEPFKYDNETRCDLHPRWDRAGKTVCIDSVYEGIRNIYIYNFGEKDDSSCCYTV